MWGFYGLHDMFLLEPYHFALEAIKKLAVFVDKYLELLRFASFIAIARTKGDDFTKTLSAFEERHLGF
jgi:hypothetical protein